MDKEEALLEFLKGLRITLNNASVYFKEHPFFIKSVSEFKSRIDLLLASFNPIKVGIAPESLFIDGKFYNKTQLHVELAVFFHIRKIKSIEIRKGVTVDELIIFLSSLALAPKEILKRGGVGNILAKEKNMHCLVEDLDYSQLLRGSGEETKDIWTYMFGEAAEKKDEETIKQCVDNFGSVVGNFKAKDLAEDEDLRKNICSFLACLKDEKKDKFDKCSKDMFKAVMKHKGAIPAENVEKIKAFFKDVNEEQFADLLLDDLVKDDNFDTLSLQLFSKLTGEERQKNISLSLLNRVTATDPLKDNPRAAKKVRDLLSSSDSQVLSDGYRNILASLLKNISFEKGVFFDRSRLYLNYRYILLDLLDEERDEGKLALIITKLLGEWGNIVNDLDARFLRCLCDITKRIKKENTQTTALFEGLDKRISEFIEHLLWEERSLPDMEYLIEYLDKSSSKVDFYLNKIFVEERLSPAVLKLFFKSFPGQKQAFYKQLEIRRQDMDFFIRMINNLKRIDPKQALEALTYIYSFSNEMIRIEVLKVMQGLPEASFGFIILVLKKGDALVKKEALGIAAKDLQLRKEAVNALLAISSPLGLKNKLLLENMGLIDEAGFKEAADYLYFLKNKRYFWNRDIRKKADEILRNWNARKD